MRIGAMNRLAEVGRVTPSTLRSSDGLVSALGISATEDGCAPFFALQESVVVGVGARRAARVTFRFMESFDLQDWTRIGGDEPAWRSAAVHGCEFGWCLAAL